MTISFITTIYNEEGTIERFLNSIYSQTQLPDEIIVVDGGSTDKTIERIKEFGAKKRQKSSDNQKSKVLLKLFVKKGNRSVGRNEAVKHAAGDIIVCSDSGNILDKNWVKRIAEPFENKGVDVVAGYYKGLGENVFQKCVIPYALVMPDKVNPQNFLPATRSIAFTKAIWKSVGGFNEKLSHNEDYAFAKALQKSGAKIIFQKSAIVYWIPRNTIKEAFVMFFRFAYGDAEARIWRPKVIFVFIRYLIAILFLLFVIIIQSTVLFTCLILLFLLYLLWAITKNYKYVEQWQAIFILPLLQLVADWAVLKGTAMGVFNKKITF